MKIKFSFIIGGFVIIGLLLLYFKSIIRPEPMRDDLAQRPSFEVTEKLPQVVFSLDPASSSLNQGAELVVSINILSEVELGGIDLKISYSAKLLQFQDANPGTFFTNPTVLIKKVIPEQNVIIYSLDADTNAAGAGSVAIIRFRAVKPGEARISIDSQTVIGVKSGIEINAIYPSTGLYTINDN